MKQNFAAGLLGSLVGVTLLLVILFATGLVGAQGPIEQPGEGGSDGITVETQPLRPTGGGGPDAPVGTVFSYQGQLKIGGVPFTGECDMQFTLWNGTSTSGIFIITVAAEPSPVQVTNGLFVAYMDFGDQFKGDYRAIQPRVRCPAGSGAYQILPDQVIYPVPYALSLRAGATISGNTLSNGLNVINSNTSARGAYFRGNGSSAALRVDNLNASVGGTAIYGLSERYHGVWGEAHDSAAAGLVGYNTAITGTALLLANGGIRVQSAGLNTDTPVFIHQVQTGAGGNICSGSPHITVIDHPLINGKQNAILIITPNSGVFGAVAPAPSHPVAVLYDTGTCGFGAGRWAIYDSTAAALTNNQRFNVLAVLP